MAYIKWTGKYWMDLGGALITASCLYFGGANFAHAAVPSVGGTAMIPQAVLCDAKAQVVSLFEQSKKNDGGAAIMEAYNVLNKQKDEAGEPTCNLQSVMGVPVVSVDDLGSTFDFSGNPLHGWAVEVKNNKGGTAFILYGEREVAKSEDPF